MLRALRYAFDEAVVSLWRGRHAGLLSTATIAVALFVLGGLLLCTANLERLGQEWGRAAELSVYLDDQATEADRRAVEGMLGTGGVVAGYEFVSKAEALQRFKQTFADLGGTIDALGGNPLPASYEVKLQPATGREANVDALASALRGASGVADVRYDRQWLDRLLSAISTIRLFGLALGAVLVLAAALTVANVVRLNLHARRDELEIMQLVGAPSAFVRGPFVVEGLLQGGIGALVALAVLAALYAALQARYLAPLAASINLSSVRFLSPGVCAGLLVGGMAVGCAGGLVASRRR